MIISKKEKHFWRLFVLYYDALIFFLISLPLINAYPALVTIIIAFTAAIQWLAFDKIDGRTYTSLFTTGNLKGVATNLYGYWVTREKVKFDRFIHFLTVVLAFIVGAIVQVFFHHLFRTFSILLVSILFLVIAIPQSIQLWYFYCQNPFIVKKEIYHFS